MTPGVLRRSVSLALGSSESNSVIPSVARDLSLRPEQGSPLAPQILLQRRRGLGERILGRGCVEVGATQVEAVADARIDVELERRVRRLSGGGEFARFADHAALFVFVGRAGEHHDGDRDAAGEGRGIPELVAVWVTG